MKLAYQYKLIPEAHQSQVIDEWIELSRRQYNFRLGERFRWFDSTRTPVNACPLNVSIVTVDDIYRNIPLSKILSKGKRKGEEYSLINQGYVDWPNVQKDDLTSTKRLFPEYKEMPSQVLQNVIERVTRAFDRFVKGDGNGKRSGKPKFKGKPYYRSICFPQSVSIVDFGKVELPKIGVVEFVEHRPIPSGFTVKTATIVKELDGYSISFALDDESVPVEAVEMKVDPRGTSQYCHACLNQVPKSLKDRWHDCPNCLESLPRDVNSGKLIKWIGLNTVGMDSASLKNALNSAPIRTVTTKQEARVLSVLR